jgi:hypothetical protein
MDKMQSHRTRVRLKVGRQAAAFSSVRNCGNHRRNTSSNSLFNTLVRACLQQ